MARLQLDLGGNILRLKGDTHKEYGILTELDRGQYVLIPNGSTIVKGNTIEVSYTLEHVLMYQKNK